jgi:hypothetical protein
MTSTRKANKIYHSDNMHVVGYRTGIWRDRYAEELFLVDVGWLARFLKRHARCYAEVEDALTHVTSTYVEPPFDKQKFLETAPYSFTDTKNITTRRFYVITASVEKELLVGIWLCTKEHLRQHLPGGNVNQKFTNMKEFSRYEQAVAHWVAENSEDAPFYRRA